LTTPAIVVILSNMDAKLMLNERHIISEDSFAEMVMCSVTSPLSGSRHSYKYRLALVVKARCVLRYDNESGKGDHRHIGDEEFPYLFPSPKALLDDFWNDVDNRRP
jgi:hypothetical protein